MMAKALFFSGQSSSDQQFDFEREYPFLDELLDGKPLVSFGTILVLYHPLSDKLYPYCGVVIHILAKQYTYVHCFAEHVL